MFTEKSGEALLRQILIIEIDARTEFTEAKTKGGSHSSDGITNAIRINTIESIKDLKGLPGKSL